MDWRRDPRISGPYSPVSGHTTPRENIELVQSPQNPLSPTPYKGYPENPAVYHNIEEFVPYPGHHSQQSLVQQEPDPPCEPTPWRPGFWKRFPWLGVVGLILCFLCIGGAIIVLHSSNQQPVNGSKVEPTVILAILTAVFNLALALALSQGARISWWYVDRSSRKRTVC
jgi:hypothetical protein